MLFGRWIQRRLQSTSPNRGYDIEQVDAFLAYVGSEHAHGVDGEILADAIRDARFTMASSGYDPETIDRHLSRLHDQLTTLPVAASAA